LFPFCFFQFCCSNFFFFRIRSFNISSFLLWVCFFLPLSSFQFSQLFFLLSIVVRTLFATNWSHSLSDHFESCASAWSWQERSWFVVFFEFFLVLLHPFDFSLFYLSCVLLLICFIPLSATDILVQKNFITLMKTMLHFWSSEKAMKRSSKYSKDFFPSLPLCHHPHPGLC
jgi:hypothetical protein